MSQHHAHADRNHRGRLPVAAVLTVSVLTVAAVLGATVVMSRGGAAGRPTGAAVAAKPPPPPPAPPATVPTQSARPAPLHDAPAGSRGKVVYLSFDDGPHPQYTPQVLD